MGENIYRILEEFILNNEESMASTLRTAIRENKLPRLQAAMAVNKGAKYYNQQTKAK